jgi:hypothetical protein
MMKYMNLIIAAAVFCLAGTGAKADYKGCMENYAASKHCENYWSFYDADQAAGKQKCESLAASACAKEDVLNKAPACGKDVNDAARKTWDEAKLRTYGGGETDSVQGHFALRYIAEYGCNISLE